ncbi:MAG: imidazole glycerol phosphate synthase subunit HisH [Pseudomonadota bacterium]
MQTVVLVDYGSGNVHSARKALVRAAHEAGIAADIVLSGDPDRVAKADRVVLPGVGAFGACRAMLDGKAGLVDALTHSVLEEKQPFLGICVGMQLLADEGVEHGHAAGLGWIGGQIRPLSAPGLKIPHMGWNTVEGAGHPLLPPDGDAYFVHSYCFQPNKPDAVAAQSTYGETFCAMVAKGNVAGVQFHPEKSQAYGLQFLSNFLTWDPS